jgi:hypothetical protein
MLGSALEKLQNHFDTQHGIEYNYTTRTGKESIVGVMHDSGERRAFETGAVRDRGDMKPRMVLISPFAMRRLGEWLRLGAVKYSERNWEKGIPFSACLDSLERHLNAVKAGETNEDHVAAIMCNAMFIAHYQEMIARNMLPESLNDIPVYNTNGGCE